MSRPIAILLLGLALPAVSMAETATEFVNRIYSDHSPETSVFLEEKSLPLYTPEVQAWLRKALAIQNASLKAFPNNKPPFSDWPIISDIDVDVFRVIRESPGESGQKTVVVECFDREEDKAPSQFIIFQLRPKDSTWQIADIHFVHLSRPGKEHPENNLLERWKALVEEYGK